VTDDLSCFNVTRRVSRLRRTNHDATRDAGTTPLTPPPQPPAYQLLPDESPDIRADIAAMIPNSERWLDIPNAEFCGRTPRSLIGTELEWFLRNFLRMLKYGIPT
jgi:hypothetical protein